MRMYHALLFLFFSIPYSLGAVPVDTTINGVPVRFDYDSSIFPESWRVAPINGWGESIVANEIERTEKVIRKALNKYPAIVLESNLKAVFYLKSMKFYEIGFGGTNSDNALYLTNDGVDLGYTDAYLEQTFHHEFSSILFRNFPALLDTTAWNAANVKGFIYNDPEDGVGAIRSNQSSQSFDTVLCARGCLTQYTLSSLENDLNTIAQNLFRPDPGFWEIVESYPLIRKKVSLLIEFYLRIHSKFTEAYFRQFATP